MPEEANYCWNRWKLGVRRSVLRSRDHQISSLQQCVWNFETDCPRRSLIYREFELGRLLYGKFSGLCPPQNFIDKSSGASKQIGAIRPVSQEGAFLNPIPSLGHERNVSFGRERQKSLAMSYG